MRTVRRAALWLIVLGLGAPSSAWAQAPTETQAVYSAGARAPIAFFLHYGSAGSVSTGDTSGVLKAVDEALSESTGLVRARLPESHVARCAEDFTVLDLCVFTALFPTLDFAGPDAQVPSPQAAALEVQAQPGFARLVFNVSIAQVRGRKDVRLRAFSSTTAAAALAREQALARSEGAAMDAFELQSVLTDSTVKVVSRVEVDNLADPRLYRDLFGELRSLTSAYPVLGQASISGEHLPPGTLIFLDGKQLGPVTTSGARIVDLRPGVHTLELQAEGHDPASLPITVQPGQKLSLAPTLVSQAGRTLRRVGFWSGAAVIAGGVAVMAASAFSAGSATITCQRPKVDSVCPAGGIAKTDLDLTQTGNLDRVHTGVPLLPIGAAITGLGAALLGTTLLFGGP